MAAKLTRLTHKIAIPLHLMAENFTICSSRSRRPVRKLLYTPSFIVLLHIGGFRLENDVGRFIFGRYKNIIKFVHKCLIQNCNTKLRRNASFSFRDETYGVNMYIFPIMLLCYTLCMNRSEILPTFDVDS